MSPVFRAGLRANVKRWGSLFIVIALAVSFITASVGIGQLVVGKGVQLTERSLSGADTVVTGLGSRESRAGVERQVTAAGGTFFADEALFLRLRSESAAQTQDAFGVRPPEFGQQQVSQGRLPHGPREIALDENSLTVLDISIGSRISVSSALGLGVSSSEWTVVGVLSSESWKAAAVVDMSAVPAEQRLGPSPDRLLVRGMDASRLTLPAGATLVTPQSIIDAARKDESGRASVVPFLVFALIALFVAVLVISTTMSVLTLRRVRELALLRLLGASRRQIVQGLILESLVLGATGATAGMALGLAGLWAITLAVPLFAGVAFVPPLGQLVLAWLAGIAAVLLGSFSALRLASRVRPLQAVSADEAALRSQKLSRRISQVTLVFFVISTGVMLATALQHKLAPAVISGILSAHFLLFAFRGYAAPLAAACSRAVAPGSEGRLASRSLLAAPGRSASAASALLIGVTLVTMLFTGVGTVRALALESIEKSEPFDIMVPLIDRAATERLAEAQKDKDKHVPSVPLTLRGDALPQLRAIKHVVGAERIDPVWQGKPLAKGEPGPVLYALPENADHAARGSAARLADNQVFGQPADPESQSKHPSLPSELTGPKGTVTLTEGMKTLNGSTPYLITHATAERLGTAKKIDALPYVVIKVEDSITPQQLAAVQEAASQITGIPSEMIYGGAQSRIALEDRLKVIANLALGLLGMSIVIALVGISDTLALSQMERTRENSLLRAIGMSRGAVSRLVTWESVGLTAAALLVAMPLGVLYGWAGALAAIPDPTVGVPAPVVAPLVLGVTAAAGVVVAVLASLVPAWRASKTTPCEGLAQA